MKIMLDPQQMRELRWVQWTNRQGVLVAHAIDPTSEARTGKARTVSGAIIPKVAVDATDTTPRDEFSLQLVSKAHQHWKKVHEAPKEAASAPANPPPPVASPEVAEATVSPNVPTAPRAKRTPRK